jgi:hypothetical protein
MLSEQQKMQRAEAVARGLADNADHLRKQSAALRAAGFCGAWAPDNVPGLGEINIHLCVNPAGDRHGRYHSQCSLPVSGDDWIDYQDATPEAWHI